jgi:hypothetical protein
MGHSAGGLPEGGSLWQPYHQREACSAQRTALSDPGFGTLTVKEGGFLISTFDHGVVLGSVAETWTMFSSRDWPFAPTEEFRQIAGWVLRSVSAN